MITSQVCPNGASAQTGRHTYGWIGVGSRHKASQWIAIFNTAHFENASQIYDFGPMKTDKASGPG
jgi:hypothetical protein